MNASRRTKKHKIENMKQNLMEARNQWATRPADQRFETLQALRDSVHNRRMRSRSQDADLTGVQVTADADGIFVNGQTTKATPTHYAFGQLATALHAPAGYLRTLPAALAAQNLMHGVKTAGRDALKFMSLASTDADSESRVLQAVTSPTYGRIWDADVADAATRIVERTNGRFYNPRAYKTAGRLGGETVASGLYASDRDIFIFMIDGGSVLDVGERAQLNRGFFLKNSEVGAATFSLTTFLFNMVCGNHIVWGAQDMNNLTIRHTKNGPYRFDGEATPALMAYADASAAPLESAIRRAMDRKLSGLYASDRDSNTKVEDAIAGIATRVGTKFNKTEIREAIAYAEREEGKCETLWDLTQGLTAYARGFDFLDARVDLETRAGKLLELVKD
jgi:hypothetical protein